MLVSLPGKKEVLFSQHFACPYCDVSFGELAPRTFSFNSPYGACKACNGLGTKMEFNKELLVPDKSLTLGMGALAPLGKLRGEWGKSQLDALGALFGFDLETPFSQLSERAHEAIFFG